MRKILHILMIVFVAFWIVSCSTLINKSMSQEPLSTKQISDLTDPALWSAIRQKAQTIFEGKQSSLVINDKRFEKLVRLLAVSKQVIANLNQKVHVTVVFAVYKETNRMLPKTLHEHGEDCICEKIRQMDWFSDCPNFSWDMVIVDDGCPESSGKKVQKILNEYSKKTKKWWPVTVLFLSDLLKKPAPHLKKLRSTKESTKGGSIYYGLWYAYKNFKKVSPQADHHLVLYTDADLSAHLGQIGIALDKIINHGFKIAVGSRKIDAHLTQRPLVQMKAGKLCTYLLNNLFPDFKVADTQSGFKLLRKEIVQELFKHELTEYGWCFDVEILLLANQLYPGCIKEFGFTWIDSVAESKTRKIGNKLYYLKCYMQFYKGLERLHQQYAQPKNQRTESFRYFISSLDVEKLDAVLEHCPFAITERSDLELLTYKGLEASDLM